MDRLGQQADQSLTTRIDHTHEPLTTYPQGQESNNFLIHSDSFLTPLNLTFRDHPVVTS